MAQDNELNYECDENPHRPVELLLVLLILINLELISQRHLVLFLQIASQETQSIIVLIEGIVNALFNIVAHKEAPRIAALAPTDRTAAIVPVDLLVACGVHSVTLGSHLHVLRGAAVAEDFF